MIGTFLKIPWKLKSMPEAAPHESHPLDTMLAISDLLTNRRYAAIYARVYELDTPTVDEIATHLESSTTTVYDDVNHLTNLGVIDRVTDTQPHRYQAQSIEITVLADEETYQLSPALVVALARAAVNENLSLYLDRHGTTGLARALEHARKYVQGQTNARVVARAEDIPVLEAETVLQELRAVIRDVEPDRLDDVDVGELDDAVDETLEE